MRITLQYEPPQPRLPDMKWFIPAVVAFLVLIMFIVLAHAEPATEGTASFYTVASCLKESGQCIMANGRRLDDNRLTCASWYYPFGTLLRVTNIDTGISVIIEVSDRGPARRLVRKGRILDLSKAAFSSLAPLSQGVIQVKIEVIR